MCCKLNSMSELSQFFNIKLHVILSHTLGIALVIKNDKSVYVALVKHILNFHINFRKLYLIDSQ